LIAGFHFSALPMRGYFYPRWYMFLWDSFEKEKSKNESFLRCFSVVLLATLTNISTFRLILL